MSFFLLGRFCLVMLHVVACEQLYKNLIFYHFSLSPSWGIPEEKEGSVFLLLLQFFPKAILKDNSYLYKSFLFFSSTEKKASTVVYLWNNLCFSLPLCLLAFKTFETGSHIIFVHLLLLQKLYFSHKHANSLLLAVLTAVIILIIIIIIILLVSYIVSHTFIPRFQIPLSLSPRVRLFFATWPYLALIVVFLD